MNKMDFLMSLNKFGKQINHKYEEEFNQAASVDILKKMRPSAEEVMEMFAWLRPNTDYPPRIKQMREALMLVRRNADISKDKKRVLVPCKNCRTKGFLYREFKGDRYVMGCGCGNTPENFSIERCKKELLERDLVQIEEIMDYAGRQILKDMDEWNADRWQEMIDFYSEDKWVPKWIKERFEDGNFDRPSSEEYPARQRGQTSQEFKDEKIGDIPAVGERPAETDCPF